MYDVAWERLSICMSRDLGFVIRLRKDSVVLESDN